jgi:Xaa-Pro aminopeptidase
MILHEKAEQAQSLLAETGLDCWLTLARETELHPDPGVEMVVGTNVVRNSAFLLAANGERIAIVANFDTSAVRGKGVFREVIGYDEDIREPLLTALKRLDPQKIGLNYSTSDVTADGLTHGHWLLLQQLLGATPYLDRLTSAAPLLSRLRGRKTRTEIARIRSAVQLTERIVDSITPQVRLGVSERDLARFVHACFAEHGVSPAWSADGCPIVNSGPASDAGHTYPSESIRVEAGLLVHIDLGVRLDGYCSDLQRMWYVLRSSESAPPADVQRAVDAVVAAIDSAAAVLRPGAIAVGHGLGRAVHDGGTMLGPRWPCYGRNVDAIVEAGNVFTLELGVPTSAGILGLEEDVLVTPDGCEFLSTRQRELNLVLPP